ncbi:MAG: hypothetical protein M0D57_20130 [Sphingobacteriales bacterium JAD_PAG50586_3]|nr:MAG: hypothetical protein M0D57_20130 [Sphingobacteriales bacterium JAD_PAG50586_3]
MKNEKYKKQIPLKEHTSPGIAGVLSCLRLDRLSRGDKTHRETIVLATRCRGLVNEKRKVKNEKYKKQIPLKEHTSPGIAGVLLSRGDKTHRETIVLATRCRGLVNEKRKVKNEKYKKQIPLKEHTSPGIAGVLLSRGDKTHRENGFISYML